MPSKPCRALCNLYVLLVISSAPGLDLASKTDKSVLECSFCAAARPVDDLIATQSQMSPRTKFSKDAPAPFSPKARKVLSQHSMVCYVAHFAMHHVFLFAWNDEHVYSHLVYVFICSCKWVNAEYTQSQGQINQSLWPHTTLVSVAWVTCSPLLVNRVVLAFSKLRRCLCRLVWCHGKVSLNWRWRFEAFYLNVIAWTVFIKNT